MKKACVLYRLSHGLLLLGLFVSAICCVVGGEPAASSASPDPVLRMLPRSDEAASDKTLRLSLDEAVGLFLRRNLDLLIAQFGIEISKGEEVTARLFPNPVVSVGVVTSPVDGRTLSSSGQFYPQIQQLFELAGKRGYRIESAEFGTQSAEAGFEDAVRQLGFAVKDAYYRVQLARRRLALAEENKDRFSRILEINTIRFKKGFIAEIELIRIRLQYIDFQSREIQALQEVESALSDLRQLLRISPATDLELTSNLEFKRLDLDRAVLGVLALESRPDVRVKRFTLSQREADLKLAKAYRIPDVTVGAGYAIQGPRGPDNSNQIGISLGLPLPLFNRNQGGIMQAEAAMQSAQADLSKTLNLVENQVDVAYRNVVHSRRLVEAYLSGVLDDARSTLTIVERAYERGGATLVDLLDAARSSWTIQENFIEALFTYQRNVLQLENAVGANIGI
ncbi:MAG: TolC family protein [Nitrospira sp.]|nr:TolC family protein [Nitrospira sp.]